MTGQEVHSQRRSAPTPASNIVVVGDSPVALAIRAEIGARRSSLKATAPNRFAGAKAIVLVAHGADFEQSMRTKQAERRLALEERAERVMVDALIARVPHVVVISSAMVNGASLGREIIADDTPPRDLTDGFVGDIIHCEQILQRAVLNITQGAGETKFTVLRMAAVVGPGVDTLITRHFEAPRLLSLKGEPRDWQFVHVNDVAHAVETVVDQHLYGSLVVGAVRPSAVGTVEQTLLAAALSDANMPQFEPDTLSTATVCTLARTRTIELTEATAFAMAERLHQIGVLPAPPVDMEYAVYDWTVRPDRLLAAGWRPEFSSAQCVGVLMDQVHGKMGVGGRRVDAAALGAAGAAVAVLGTAAAWRQVRTGRK